MPPSEPVGSADQHSGNGVVCQRSAKTNPQDCFPYRKLQHNIKLHESEQCVEIVYLSALILCGMLPTNSGLRIATSAEAHQRTEENIL
jgi:hypothetical protein